MRTGNLALIDDLPYALTKKTLKGNQILGYGDWASLDIKSIKN